MNNSNTASPARARSNARLVPVRDDVALQRELLQRIFDHIPVLISMTGQDGHFQLVNRQFQRTLGWSLKDVVNKEQDVLAKIFPDPQELARAQRFMAECSGEWADFRPRTKDGKILDLTATNVRLSDGTQIGISHDITARKQAEEALRASEERFRQLAESIREVFWIYSPELRRPVYVSPAYEGVFGRSRETMEEDYRVLAAIHPEDRPRMAQFSSTLPEEDFEVEYRVLAPDGSVRWIWDRGFAIRDESGRIFRYAGIAEDITDRKRSEQQLKEAADRLRALAREEERIRIAREIHDELGSALTSLRWDLEGLDNAVRELGASQQLPGVSEKLRNMLQLADATFNAVRRIASELRPIVLDDLGLVAAMESQAQELQTRTGIRFEIVCSAASVNLSAEKATAIFRIFQEALTNVVRHARATRAEIFIDREGDELVVLISDNGRGIAPSAMSAQASLGFLGMRERARQMGGKLDIRSIEGQGTSVGVRVPV